MPSQADFDKVLALIDAARAQAVAAVNTTLIELYWNIGAFISRKIESADWGEGVVDQLAAHIANASRPAGIYPPQSVPNAAILRDLPGRRESLGTAETIALDPQSTHPGQVEAG